MTRFVFAISMHTAENKQCFSPPSPRKVHRFTRSRLHDKLFFSISSISNSCPFLHQQQSQYQLNCSGPFRSYRYQKKGLTELSCRTAHHQRNFAEFALKPSAVSCCTTVMSRSAATAQKGLQFNFATKSKCFCRVPSPRHSNQTKIPCPK